jgi:hypothetical protein
MHWLWGIIVLALDIWAIVNVFKSGTSVGAKVGWLLAMLIFPIVGFLAWLLAGPKDQKRLPRR